jgi:hypothetical protein
VQERRGFLYQQRCKMERIILKEQNNLITDLMRDKERKRKKERIMRRKKEVKEEKEDEFTSSDEDFLDIT